ncbi:uncharacterized protein V6R79_007742 [Siganus canaliculatus]
MRTDPERLSGCLWDACEREAAELSEYSCVWVYSMRGVGGFNAHAQFARPLETVKRSFPQPNNP